MLILENPIPALVVGGALVALSIIALLQTGRRLFLYVAVGLAVVTFALCVLEWLVVTPGEVVADRIHALAADLERNQPQLVLAYISPRSPDLRSYAERVLRDVKIKDAAVKRNLQVVVHPRQGLATATFNGVIQLDAPRFDLSNYRYARKFIVRMRYEDGAWMISEFRDENPIGREHQP